MRGDRNDLICFSDQDWMPALGRPHRLMSRFAEERRVFFVEPPRPGKGRPRVATTRTPEGVTVLTLSLGETGGDPAVALRKLLDGYLKRQRIRAYTLWYYDPLAVTYSHQLRPDMVVYDRANTFAGLRGPEGFTTADAALLGSADLVLTRDAEPAAHDAPLERPAVVGIADAGEDAGGEEWDDVFRHVHHTVAALEHAHAA